MSTPTVTPPPGYTLEQPSDTQQSQPASTLPPGYTIEQPQDTQPAGEEKNDVGETVIVPQDGESFLDTMKRAAAHGGQVQQSDIDKEMATAPKKVAETLGGAPVIGFGGATALAGAGESLLGSKAAYQAVVKMAQAHPDAARHIAKFLVGSALGGEVGHSAKSALLGALLSTLTK